MTYTVLIALHAGAGVVAFVTGLLAAGRPRFFEAYRCTLIATVAFLVLAVIVSAAGRDATNWVVSAALVGLAGVMLVRAHRAGRLRPEPGSRPSADYVHHVGFGVIGLFDAFWVVALLRAGMPGWAVGAIAVGIAVVGHLLLVRTARAATMSVTSPALSPASEGVR